MKALLITRDGLHCYRNDVPDNCIFDRTLHLPCKTRQDLDPFDPRHATFEQMEVRRYETTRPDPDGVTIFYEIP